MEKTIEHWERWFRDHRSEELSILVIESCRVLLRKGDMTAEDVHHIPVKNPSVRGALMKQLKRMGLVQKTGLFEGSTEQSHGHTMFVWSLADAYGARQILDRCAAITLPPQEPKIEKQMEML